MAASMIILALAVAALLATWMMAAQPTADARGGAALKKSVKTLQTQVATLTTQMASANTSISTLNTYRTCARATRPIYRFSGYEYDGGGGTVLTTALDTEAGGTVVGHLSLANC